MALEDEDARTKTVCLSVDVRHRRPIPFQIRHIASEAPAKPRGSFH
jgi:hypothetical protein